MGARPVMQADRVSEEGGAGQLPDDGLLRHQAPAKNKPVGINATGPPGGDENISDNEHITAE